MFQIVKLENIKMGQGARYLIQNLIPARDITVVWGKPKSGKTFLVLDMALHIAAGRDYRDRPTAHGAVLYCTFEGAFMFPSRVHAAISGLGMGLEIPFYYCPDAKKFDKVGGAEGLIHSISNLIPVPPVLVVLDTVNRSLDGSENSDEDMTHYTRCAEEICRRFECAVIVVHHCGVSGDKPRGHTSLTGTCAAQLKITRASNAPVVSGKSLMVSAEVEFMKDGPEGEVEFSWIKPIDVEMGGVRDSSCYVVPAPAPTGSTTFQRDSQTHIKKALSVLQEGIGESDFDHIKLSEWKARFHTASRGRKEAVSRAFYRALEELKAMGAVTVDRANVSLNKTS